jgi:DNA-binding LytR/AlgR family response regulator
MAEGGPSKTSALIVDDEPVARARVRRLLAEGPDIEVVGESRNGIEALTHIRELAPDLLFLDVQMPGKDGLQVLEDLKAEETPVVIFLTAYDKYAVRAFDAAALDYLLKPFDEERFARAVARACATSPTGTTQESGRQERANGRGPGGGGGRARRLAGAAPRTGHHPDGRARPLPPRRRDRLD